MTGRRTIIVAALLGLALLGGGYWAFFVRPERHAEPAPAAPPEALVLMASSGLVEVAGADGGWHPARVGARLGPGQRLRTDDEGSAVLGAADGATVKLLSATEAYVDELRRDLERLALRAGMAEADVPERPGRMFELALTGRPRAGATAAPPTAPAAPAVARTHGARFTAFSDGAGGGTVATRRGEVILSANGREVVIRTGQYARVAPGAPPEAPVPLPPSLFLRVAWPPARTNQRRVTVKGTTTPGARVRIDDRAADVTAGTEPGAGTPAGHINRRWVAADAAGAYRADLDLPDGPHALAVHAEHAGVPAADEPGPTIVVDTTTDFTVQRPRWRR